MHKRRFASQTVLSHATTVAGIAVDHWNTVLTTGFVKALPSPLQNVRVYRSTRGKKSKLQSIE